MRRRSTNRRPRLCPTCPNCGYKLAGVRVDVQALAIRMVVARATRKPRAVAELASVYEKHAKCSYLAGRRAVVRLAKKGVLRRVKKGIYVAR